MNQDNVALYPVSVEERDAALALYRAVERLDQDWRGDRAGRRRRLRGPHALWDGQG